MKRLFGTDGIRGVAGEPPLDPRTVRTFGIALATILARESPHPPRVLIGRDTRQSGEWLRDALFTGLEAGRAEFGDAGVITTPGLAHAVRTTGHDAGVMISASHNPFEDNGLKVFAANGMKMNDNKEREIEGLMLDSGIEDPGEKIIQPCEDLSVLNDYLKELEILGSAQDGLRGCHLVLDCANGSAAAIAPRLFGSLGADLETIGADPDGRNINLNCGSLHLDGLAREVQERGVDLGIAFDGDADRALAVDRRGRTVDGDHILYLAARHLKRMGRLRNDVVVATIMSNFWLEKKLEEEGIRLLRAQVGDKYVLERMLQEDAVLGGEQSGHIIFRDHATTGDGILTGIMLLHCIKQEADSLEEILDRIIPYPQLLINVRVHEKPDLRVHPVIGPAVEEAERALYGTGRVVLRYSGTEPLTRVMVEGRDPDAVRYHAEQLAGIISRELGTTKS
ncbi:MAG: phosphoglucosamine mutase [Acidobacteria bacterium]|uniref:Phosphoglucosamine mutase n=1 Tax=Candidatus Polarisedimenticola svalbardensis TaxID=2886004 RepID=A0A8J6XZ53_9BACT|nr:phosphoglucosamine mutase [Candidatus Polarisedimenticola svalbardensis]